MGKLYTRSEVVARLREEINARKPLFMPNFGCGLTAKVQERGGADLITVSPTSWWRLKGMGSAAANLPYANINEIIFDIAVEITANVEEVPVISLSGPHNPLLSHKLHIEKLRSLGISGITPWMTRGNGKVFCDKIDNIGMGFEKEVSFIETAQKMDVFSFVYAYSPKEAEIFAQAGADVISAHVGATVGGMLGAKTKLTLDEAVDITQEIFDAARKYNPNIILFIHGGPISTADDAAYVYQRTTADGFVGGSAAERMPIEQSVLAATQSYKAYTR